MRKGFTVLEVLMTLGLVAILTSILLMVVVRVARMTRVTAQASLRRKHWIEAAEIIRWELRNLFVPAQGAAPTNAIAVGLVGTPDTPLWGEPGSTEGRDSLTFLTSQPRKQKGVCEVGFRVQTRNGGDGLDLGYREFPLRNRAGLHGPLDAQEAPWTILLDDVTHLSLDYSEDGWIWKRDWTDTTAPKRVRVHLEAKRLPALDFQVTPGMGGGRW
ncbi:MAG: prepilin-type N-terminal cleavage/methylation domain-containing protein [Candidatus Eremiobacteraeota bacterium]|nr:prepilin-type N-terminal cleavage/methylation domain-containing protein [Candidatus Eremiobacteraeota bacterium]